MYLTTPAKFKLILIIIFASLFFTGCAYKPKNYSEKEYIEVAQSHIIRMNRRGYVIDPLFASKSTFEKNPYKFLPQDQAQIQMDKMIINALHKGCKKSGNSDCSSLLKATKFKDLIANDIYKIKEARLLLYVHGGLNFYRNTDERMENGLKRIKSDTQDWTYPVYVSWPSHIPGTQAERYFDIREGRDTAWWSALPSIPFVLFEDILTAVGKAPANLWYQFTNDKDRYVSGSNNNLLSNVWTEAEYQFGTHFEIDNVISNKYYAESKGNISMNRSIYCNAGVWNNTESFVEAGLFFVRWPIGVLWNGVIAGNSWDIMKRRARAIAYPIGEVNEQAREEELRGEKLGYLFEQLFEMEKHFKSEFNTEIDFNITLIGHSMGSIVLNNLLARYQSEFEATTMLDSIVYMGAAANIADTLAIIPDILKNNPNGLSFHNLTLNRVAEVAENHYYISSNGSLLVSIDKFHDAPEHHLLRTVGSEVNVQSSLTAITKAFEQAPSEHLKPKEKQDRVIFKAYNKYNDEIPYTHGDFDDIDYWKPSEWEIEPNYTRKCRAK